MNALDILVLEDEQRAGEKLIDTIHDVAPHANIIWKRSVAEAEEFLTVNTGLDLIFSDIELMDGNAFQIYRTIKPNCPIVFCTAYNTFYEDAFRTNGIAYLLKPYSKSDFLETWGKFHLLFENKITANPSALLAQLKKLVSNRQDHYKNTFSIRKRDGVFPLKVEEINYFQAQGDFVLAIAKEGRKHVINDSLVSIENKLDPRIFFRINRSEIVNRDSILKYNTYIKNRLEISLFEPNISLYTSNSRTPGFREWLDN